MVVDRIAASSRPLRNLRAASRTSVFRERAAWIRCSRNAERLPPLLLSHAVVRILRMNVSETGSPSRKARLMIASLVCFCLTTSGAESAIPIDIAPRHFGPVVHFLFRPTVTVRTESKPAAVRLLLVLPQSVPPQELLGLVDVSEAIERGQLVDASGMNRLLDVRVQVEPGKPVEFGYTAIVGIRTLRFDVETLASRGGPWEASRSERSRLQRFMTPTKSTGVGRADLRLFAIDVAGDDSNTIRVARRLYDGVRRRLEYRRDMGFKGAARCWDEGIGECCDYVALFVSLCRSSGIPARAVAGYGFGKEGWELHVWAEFHATGIGWIPCDPSLGDAGDATIIEVHWTKGHATKVHLQKGIATSWQKESNDAADAFATQSSALATHLAPSSHLVEAHKEATPW